MYVAYHDHEWGVPLHDEQALFEMLILEGFQAGLSWITILRKRENFRRAFDAHAPSPVLGRLVAAAPWRKQSITWSSTMPTACMKA